ncbi:WD40 repeat domain-containing protein [Phanerochaete sordida]|uniref:WD40 repeat domain-containing protein n=1 Tax=Phanerochaete sordida TaxID=48140 RepID=A0A9P3GMV1_9APHY|nr:WD40 repeat domain-containing protein [Phanerochaete sordida]
MPDAFFQSNKNRKRKRSTSGGDGPSSSKKPARGAAPGRGRGGSSGRGAAGRGRGGRTAAAPKRSARDEELSDATDGAGSDLDELDLRAPDVDPAAYESGEEDADETPAEKRLRLAKLYLEGVKEGLGLAEGEFDAAEIDRELISARLKQDVLENAGKVHLFVADTYDLADPPTLRTRGHRFAATSAVASEDARWLYTSGKDGCIIKWDLSTGKKVHQFFKVRAPKDSGKGKGKAKAEPAGELRGHTDEIWALALSPDGKLLASGGKDRRIGVWDVEKNEWVKGFTGHRDSISALSFRKAPAATNTPIQLYSGSFDRTLKIHDLSVMGYIETLFGHQAPVLNIDSLIKETAVSVGGRDKTVRYWKVPDESQLVFRGGNKTGWEDALEGGNLDDEMEVEGARKKPGKTTEKFIEGSIECCTMLDETTFVSGGDSGSISLWSTQKKKPIFTQPLAHGMDEAQVDTEDMKTVRKPRWVTALGCLRYSDMFASGSWDGTIRIWKLDAKLKSFALVGSVPAPGVVNSLQFVAAPRSEVAAFGWAQRDADAAAAPARAARATEPRAVLLVAGVGTEMRLGRWVQRKGEGVLNGALVVALYPRTSAS